MSPDLMLIDLGLLSTAAGIAWSVWLTVIVRDIRDEMSKADDQ